MRQIETDTVLAEFDGHLASCVVPLDRILRGHIKRFPPEEDLWWSSQEAVEVYKTCLQRLKELAPEGYYFGGHPLEPFCLGFWQILPEE